MLCALLAILWLTSHVATQAVQHRTFPSPEDAVKSLIDTVKKGDVNALLAIFGTDGKDLLSSSDQATARMNRQVFAVAAAEQWHLEDDGPRRRW